MIISFAVSFCTPENTFLLQYDEQLPQAHFAAKNLRKVWRKPDLAVADSLENEAEEVQQDIEIARNVP